MNIQIKLNYKDKVYLSNVQECTDRLVMETKNLMSRASEGKVTSLTIENGNEEYFFTKEILKKSIITVIVS